MHQKQFHIVSEFDGTKDYGIPIRPRHKKVLLLLKTNQKFAPGDFIEKNLEKLGNQDASLKHRKDIIYQSFSIGKKIGLIKEINNYGI